MSTNTKTHVFRVQELLQSWGNKDTKLQLRKSIYQQLTEADTQELTYDIYIVPDCYYPEEKSVALLEFSSAPPTFLSRLADKPGNYVLLHVYDQEVPIDRDFFGLTQLNNPTCTPQYEQAI
jgi:hypothetical protein